MLHLQIMRFNPKSKGRWKWLLIVGVPVVAILVVGKMTNTNPPTNLAQTTPDEAPELRTRLYRQTPDEVLQAAKTVAGEQKTWFKLWRISPQSEVTSGPPHHQLKVEVPVLFYTDDLTVSLDTVDGQTRVNVKSKSRVGQGDFGENRRHVAQFLAALDRQLGMDSS